MPFFRQVLPLAALAAFMPGAVSTAQDGAAPGHWKIIEADLAPVFGDGPLGNAASAFQHGRYRDVVAVLDSVPNRAPAAEYLRSLALLRLGETASGPAFAELANRYPALAGRCHFHAAVALEDAGDFDGALREYAAVPKGALLWRDAVKGRVRILKDRGQSSMALQALAELASLPPTQTGSDTAAQALYDTALIEVDAGDRVQAVAALMRLWSEHPLSALSDAAGQRLKSLGVPVPVELKIARAEALVEAHHNQRAIASLSPLASSPDLSPELSCRVRFLMGKAQRKERLYFRAIATLGPVVKECQDPSLRVRALYTLASAASIVALEDGVNDYRALVEEFADHPYADDALFFEADLLARLGRPQAARRALLTLAKLYPDGDYRAEALFKAFWLERAAGKPEDGLRYLTVLERDYSEGPETFDGERATYWRARTLAATKGAGEAAPLYESLARAHPSTYYGMLARSRLSEIDPVRADASVPHVADEAPVLPLDAGVLSDDHHLRAGVELLKMGLFDAAAEDLLAIDRSPALSAGDLEAIRLVAALLNRAGDVRGGQAISRVELRADLIGPITSATLGLWKVAYPLTHRTEVEKGCKEKGVEPFLFMALMREESALDPRALSWAGAVGMSQLMPSTAELAAHRLGIKGPMTRERLYDAGLNIQLGIETFSQFLRRFGNNPALALAAYNAGGGAVDSWLRKRGQEDLDEFVEEIPIAETRGYVRRVLRTFNTYRLLYDRRATTLTQRVVLSKREPAPGGKAPEQARP